jgi:hypothetical protein
MAWLWTKLPIKTCETCMSKWPRKCDTYMYSKQNYVI